MPKKGFDLMTSAQRSELMSRIRSKGTKQELEMRKLVTALGFRYRLNVRKLPGTPDLVFQGRKKVVFVHGCFWHMHDCQGTRMPRTNAEFWEQKLRRNAQRDLESAEKLAAAGWKVLTVWECELKKERAALVKKILDFLMEEEEFWEEIDVDAD